MEKVLSLGVVISGEDQLSPKLGKATSSIGKYEKKIKALGDGLKEYGKKTLAFGAAITAPIGLAVNSYQELAAAQGDIASLGIGESGIAKITKEAKEFSKEFAGTTAAEFVGASYDIKSGISSLSAEGVAKFTRLSAVTAAATKSTTAEMTKMFALGHGIFKDTNETDFEFGNRMSAQVGLAVKAFRTEGSDLIEGISNVGAMAKKMGVSLSEELAIIGNSKGAFNSASEAATGYRAFLQGVGSAQEDLGLQFTDSEGKMLPMVEVLEQIKEKYGDTLQTVEVQDEIRKAFGSGEAVKTINGLIDKTDQLRKSEEELNNATLENVQAMAEARNKGREFTILKQQIGTASATIGKVFAPAALKLGKAIGSVANSVGAWVDENPKLASTIGMVVGGLGLLLTVGGALILGIGAFMSILPTLSAGLAVTKLALFAVGGAMKAVGVAFATNPIGFIITAIAGGAYLIYKNWEPIKGFFLDLFDGIKKGFNWIGSAFNKVKNIGSSVKSFFGFGGNNKSSSVSSPTPAALKVSKPLPQNMAQTNHIKVNVNNPSSNVDVEKAIVSAMNKGGADRGLSDEDI